MERLKTATEQKFLKYDRIRGNNIIFLFHQHWIITTLYQDVLNCMSLIFFHYKNKIYYLLLIGKIAKGFWDIVVITAVDGAQKLAYESQIKLKLENKELPISPEYMVVSDPIGAKIGKTRVFI